jgi:hypothetical protein
MNKTIGVYLAVMMLLAALIISLGNLSVKQAEAFHSNWRDWNNNNFVERWYEEEGNPGVILAKEVYEYSMWTNIEKCTNVLNKIGGSTNCDTIMLNVAYKCDLHFWMLSSCNNIRGQQLQNYLDYRGLR